MDLLPSEREDFESREYWNSFFKIRGGENFEWYVESSDVLPFLRRLFEHCENRPLVLHVGNGNSDLPETLYHDPELCLNRAVCIDFSEVVVKEMKSKLERNLGRNHGIEFIQGDVLHMFSLSDEMFDASIDKGLLDAMLSEWSPENEKRAKVYFSELRRVLKPEKSVLVIISLLQEHAMKLIMNSIQKDPWDVKISPLVPQCPESALCPFLLECRPLSTGLTANLCIEYGGTGNLVFSDFERAMYLLDACREDFRKSFQKQSEGDSFRLVEVEIKPCDSETDLEWLMHQIRSLPLLRHVIWSSENESHGIGHEVVPIGFGICKLKVRFLLKHGDIDEVCMIIEDALEDVQSIDFIGSQSVLM